MMDDGESSAPQKQHQLEPSRTSPKPSPLVLRAVENDGTRESYTPTGPPPESLKLENIPPLKPSSHSVPDSSFDSSMADGQSILDDRHSDSLAEQAVREHLQDLDSSFVPPISPIPTIVARGAAAEDDTFVFDSPKKSSSTNAREPSPSSSKPQTQSDGIPKSSPPTPDPSKNASKQPTVEDPSHDDSLLNVQNAVDASTTSATTASLEAFSSSPTAAAAARTISRAISRASNGKSEGASHADDSFSTDNSAMSEGLRNNDDNADPGDSSELSERPKEKPYFLDAGSTPGNALRSSRPKYLWSRNASQRSSVSSSATNNSSVDDRDSDVTVGLGTDYALQSGGALPAAGPSRGYSNMSRTVSLGSMASGLDDEPVGRVMDQLETLDEHNVNSFGRDPMRTPKAKGSLAPTDTVIARRVMNVHVPESLAREYKSKGGLQTPRRQSEMTSSGVTPKRTLTLKEQSSTIERLSKENFDLKLKVMFLNDRLDKLSEEGVKEMISENVELKTGLAVLQRDNKVLRRRVKELEKQLKEEDDRPSTARSGASSEQASAADQEAQEREEELVYLRERIEEYETEIDRLRDENLSTEAEKRRMAEHVRTLQNAGEKHVGDSLGRQEEADVWKDLFEQETARREQADEENRKLRDEVFQLKQQVTTNVVGHGTSGSGRMHHTTNIYNITKAHRATSPSRPMSAFSGEAESSNGLVSVASTLVEELRREGEALRHENAELRREVGAQTSMLTSRNREKERLYQEIEDLKLASRRGGPAPSTIDSLLDRSASRAGRDRSASRVSVGTRAVSGIDEAEREELENKMAELRDKINELKLNNSDLQTELNSCTEDFEAAVEAKRQAEEVALGLQDDLDTAMNDLVVLQTERDEALQENDALQAEFEALRKEAQEELDALDQELEVRNDELQRLQIELSDRTENFNALQDEMRKLSESLVGLEDEQEKKMKMIAGLEEQLAEANKESEELEAKLLESNEKAQRLSVQQESGQDEIAFLREEQEQDKIRIGDLEAQIATAEQSLKEAHERVKELDQRLATERRQRELVAAAEKEEVQQFVNELNREASTAKDEAKRLRKSLNNREREATEWKERLMELENNLREALGDLNGTRSSLLKSIAKLQRELEETVQELSTTKAALVDKDRLLKQRDALLESHGLEARKLADMLEKERQAHRVSKHQFETFQKTHQHITRTNSSQEQRISELESTKAQDGRKIAQLERTLKEQLNERNNLLLVLWTRLSALCGSDWAHDNSLINGRALPSLEAVATMLPGFSKNLLGAVKTIETMVGGFQNRIKDVEKQIWKEYHSLETTLEQRTKKLDKLEAAVRSGIAAGTIGMSVSEREMQSRLIRLEDAYRQLKVENTTLRTASEVRQRAAKSSDSVEGHSPSPSIPTGPRGGSRDRALRNSSMARRPVTAGDVAFDKDGSGREVARPETAHVSDTDPKWILRLREMENKLKTEREGRVQDRSAARERIRELEAHQRTTDRDLQRARERERGRQ
ncbi:hypothetical protein MCOR25_006219 [Pyricularia grisea]|uniref:Anucleate primary sterigmata protein B n=1 Tax=Pyricularia grisea TaxID=148305 RepID=A0A6P8ASG2_PYRGI|nr:uncharacterized protein PgNI_09090 [Pyricularia grisea]KAI6362344.1 hypothetical protein MCOR25_006219 [Pyricularia grisea]TLD05042.1 hypothetical protein PgNI_09090 [Pyricularia grisea]